MAAASSSLPPGINIVKAEKNKNKAAVAPSAASTWLAGVVEKTHSWTQGVSDFFKEDEDAKVKALTANVDIDKLVVAFRKFAGFNDELTREEYKLFAQDVELPSKMAESLWKLLDVDGDGTITAAEKK